VLQAVPALRALRSAGPLTFAGQPRLGRLLHGARVVDAALDFDSLGLEALFTRDADPVRLLARLAGFGRVVSWFGAHDEIYPDRLRAVAAECVIASPVPTAESAVPVWRHLLATVGSASSVPGPPLEIPRSWRDQAERALTELGTPGAPLVLIHPGAGGRWKIWPAEKMAAVIAEVAAMTEVRFLVHEGPADREAAERLAGIAGVPLRRLVEPELPLLGGVLGRASAYLGADSGVSQLAAAVGAPAVILYPAATRAMWAPWSPTARALAISEDAAQPREVAAALCERLTGERAGAGWAHVPGA